VDDAADHRAIEDMDDPIQNTDRRTIGKTDGTEEMDATRLNLYCLSVRADRPILICGTAADSGRETRGGGLRAFPMRENNHATFEMSPEAGDSRLLLISIYERFANNR